MAILSGVAALYCVFVCERHAVTKGGVRSDRAGVRLVRYTGGRFVRGKFTKTSLQKVYRGTNIAAKTLCFFFRSGSSLFYRIMKGFVSQLGRVLQRRFSFRIERVRDNGTGRRSSDDSFRTITRIIRRLCACQSRILLILAGTRKSDVRRVPSQLISRVSRRGTFVYRTVYGTCRIPVIRRDIMR